MTTATAASIKQDEDARADHILNLSIRHFIQSYEPDDIRARHNFEMDLHHLVRMIYREAAKPYEKILCAGLSLSQHSFPDVLYVKEPKS